MISRRVTPPNQLGLGLNLSTRRRASASFSTRWIGGKRRMLNPFIAPEFVPERVEKMKTSIRAKVEHPFRVIKQQFGFTRVR